MSEKKASCQEVVITHKGCGGSFTIQPDTYVEKLSSNLLLSCFNCSEIIDFDSVTKYINGFCKAYKLMTERLEGEGFKVAIIQPKEASGQRQE